MITVGIDAGSRALKITLLDIGSLEVVASAIADQGINQNEIANTLLDKTLAENNLARQDIKKIVATGYARNNIDIADTTITEITCHAHGVHARFPQARTIIEIGGQDSKLLHLAEGGKVRDFAMNDRCAAGTGRFLEVVSERLDIPLDKLGEISARSQNPSAISSMCVVFAETEIIGLLSNGARREDIVAGVQASIASRVAAMAGRQIEEPVVFTGGVALIPGMDHALAQTLERPVAIVPHPQTTGSHGAALLAAAMPPASPEKP